jgi:hypothetical protein
MAGWFGLATEIFLSGSSAMRFVFANTVGSALQRARPQNSVHGKFAIADNTSRARRFHTTAQGTELTDNMSTF